MTPYETRRRLQCKEAIENGTWESQETHPLHKNINMMPVATEETSGVALSLSALTRLMSA